MATILDIDAALRSTIVTVRGIDLKVFGLTVEDFMDLLSRFSPAVALLERNEPLIVAAAAMPELLPEIILCGLGERDQKDARTVVRSLSLGEQMSLATAISELTYPEGFRPFVEQLKRLGLLRSEPAASPNPSSSLSSDSDGGALVTPGAN
jgi:hypothetical protein